MSTDNTLAIFTLSFELATQLRKGHLFRSEVDGAGYLAMAVQLNPKLRGETFAFTTDAGHRVLATAGTKDWVFVTHECDNDFIRPAYLGLTYSENYMDSGLSDLAGNEDRIEVMLAEAMVAGLPVNRLIELLDSFDARGGKIFNKWHDELGDVYSSLAVTLDEFDDGREFCIKPQADDKRFDTPYPSPRRTAL